jgi:hypothetical protein
MIGSHHTVVGNDHSMIGSHHTVVGNDHSMIGSHHTIVGNDHSMVGGHHTAVKGHQSARESHQSAVKGHQSAHERKGVRQEKTGQDGLTGFFYPELVICNSGIENGIIIFQPGGVKNESRAGT